MTTLPGPLAGDAVPRRPFGLSRWVVLVVVGETIGFLLPTAGLALGTSPALSDAPWMRYVLVVALGSGEGALLGLAQSTALRGTAGQVPRRRWVPLTAGGAATAWAIGMLAPTLSDVGVGVDVSHPATCVLAGLGGLTLLAVIPCAQWLVLRRVVPRAWRWIPLNMGAWLVGVTFTLLPGPFIDEGSAPTLVAVLYAASGLAMAATVACVTGIGLRRMIETGADGSEPGTALKRDVRR